MIDGSDEKLKEMKQGEKAYIGSPWYLFKGSDYWSRYEINLTRIVLKASAPCVRIWQKKSVPETPPTTPNRYPTRPILPRPCFVS